MTQTINLSKLVSELYANASSYEIIRKLNDYELHTHFKKAIAVLNKHIANKNEGRNTYIGHVAAYLLVSINKKIQEVFNLEERIFLEDCCVNIAISILKEFISITRENVQVVFQQIFLALEDTCSFYDYDFHRLLELLNLTEKGFALFHAQAEQPILSKSSVPCFNWEGQNLLFNEFVDVFIDYKLVENRKGFKQLFQNPPDSLNITMSHRYADEILYIFHLLNKHRFISISNGRGVYKVLEYHVLDFKKNFLKNTDARFRINSIKNSARKHQQIQEKIKKWCPKLLK